jgi:hypothetical protein
MYFKCYLKPETTAKPIRNKLIIKHFTRGTIQPWFCVEREIDSFEECSLSIAIGQNAGWGTIYNKN